MTDKLKGFVSTYKPPKRDTPFFGYLKIKNKSKGWAKKKEKSNQ